MEFVAATKDGLIVYDASQIEESGESGDWSTGKCTDGRNVKVLASMPCPPNAFGFAWSDDGALLASVCDEGVRVYDANKRYKVVQELEKVAPDVQGRAGGVRALYFSPLKNFLVTYEKWDPQYPENVHVWALQGKRAGERIRSCTLNHYTSGALPVMLINWTPDESHCLELVPGVGVVVHDGDLETPTEQEDDERVIPEPNIANFLIAPAPQRDACWVAVYVPQASMVARVSLYHLSKPSKLVMELNLPKKVKDCQMLWNFEGSALLANAMSDVDETGNSYFGSTYLYWLKPEDRKKAEVCGADKGLVQDLAWSPTSNEFMVIVGMLPAAVNLYNGTTGKLEKSLGNSKRNTLKWNPFGRFAAVAGFGTLPGDLDFYDRSKDETVASLRAALTVDCSWFADGRHFMAATVAPRMNEGNQITVYKYTGDPVLKMEFKPAVVEGRHEDTGAGARTKTQAFLFAARWRPDGTKKHEDRAASPPRDGEKRVKGLPTSAAPGTAYAPVTNAYRPR
ncbi:Eukaryotic translation initiation factor 2A (eIF-2A), partial [Durusdinium trenchii]